MSLADDLSKEPASASQKCTVGILLAGFNKQDKQAFQQAVDKIRAVPSDVRRSRGYPYTSTWLLGVLRTNGYTLSKESLRKHLNGECNCEFV